MTTKSNKADELLSSLTRAGFPSKTAKYIVAQAAHETGNFHSMLFTDFNNPFGMKHPVKRDSTSIGPQYGYASYTDLDNAAKDLFLWYEYNKVIPVFLTIDSFLNNLVKKRYFKAPFEVYSTAVKKFHALYYE